MRKKKPIEACRIYYFNLVISVEHFWFYLGNVLLKRSNFEILETSQDNWAPKTAGAPAEGGEWSLSGESHGGTPQKPGVGGQTAPEADREQPHHHREPAENTTGPGPPAKGRTPAPQWTTEKTWKFSLPSHREQQVKKMFEFMFITLH